MPNAPVQFAGAAFVLAAGLNLAGILVLLAQRARTSAMVQQARSDA